MPRKPSKKKRYNFLINRSVYEDFSLLCDDIGLVRSKTIENFLKKFNKENKEKLKKLKNK